MPRVNQDGRQERIAAGKEELTGSLPKAAVRWMGCAAWVDQGEGRPGACGGILCAAGRGT